MEPIKPEWIKGPLTKEAIAWAEKSAQSCTRDPEKPWALTSTQLRRFYSSLKMIQADYAQKKEEIPLLKPKLAYNAARNRGGQNQESELKNFYNANKSVLTELNDLGELEFSRYAAIIEAFVAFHKFYGGK
jgi:CRISPR type III-A-associated protein Csm2